MPAFPFDFLIHFESGNVLFIYRKEIRATITWLSAGDLILCTLTTPGMKSLKSHYTCTLLLLLILVLNFASDSCNNTDTLLIVGFRYY